MVAMLSICGFTIGLKASTYNCFKFNDAYAYIYFLACNCLITLTVFCFCVCAGSVTGSSCEVLHKYLMNE